MQKIAQSRQISLANQLINHVSSQGAKQMWQLLMKAEQMLIPSTCRLLTLGIQWPLMKVPALRAPVLCSDDIAGVCLCA